MRTLPQSEHCDLGLIEDDHTPDMRKAPVAADALRNNYPTITEISGGTVMSTLPTAADLRLPPNAEPDLWVGGQRDVYAQIGHVVTSNDLLSCPSVTVVAEQRVNGHLRKIQVVLDVAMNHSHAGLTAAQVRELSDLLLAGADLADRWAGVPEPAPVVKSPVELLADAFSALRAAHSQLATLPGNADSYVRAALDSISDATAVLR